MIIFPISTSGIIDMLVKITYNHCEIERVVKLNKELSVGTKYTVNISASNITKLKLKKLFLKIFILKMLRSVLQLIAWMICIKHIVMNDIVLAISFE